MDLRLDGGRVDGRDSVVGASWNLRRLLFRFESLARGAVGRASRGG